MRIRCYRVPDILVRQNRHEFIDPEGAVIKSNSKRFVILERTTTSTLNLGSIQRAADFAKDLKAQGCALVLSAGTKMSQCADLEASMQHVVLISNNGSYEQLLTDLRQCIKQSLDWEPKFKPQEQLPQH